MLCMPYLPSQVPPNRKVKMEVCLYKDIKGCETSVSRRDNVDARACLLKAEEFTLQSRQGISALTVSYQFGDENEIADSQTLTYEDIAQIVASKSVFLDLDLDRRGDSNRITLWLKPHRSQPIKKTFDLLPTAMIRDKSRIDRTVTEAQLMRLSKRLSHTNYTDLCIQLEIQYNEAMSILAGFTNNYREAYKQVLMEWRDRTGGSEDRLIVALEAAGVGGLVHDELFNGAEINLRSSLSANQIQQIGEYINRLQQQSQTDLQIIPCGLEEPKGGGDKDR